MPRGGGPPRGALRGAAPAAAPARGRFIRLFCDVFVCVSLSHGSRYIHSITPVSVVTPPQIAARAAERAARRQRHVHSSATSNQDTGHRAVSGVFPRYSIASSALSSAPGPSLVSSLKCQDVETKEIERQAEGPRRGAAVMSRREMPKNRHVAYRAVGGRRSAMPHRTPRHARHVSTRDAPGRAVGRLG